MTFKGGSSRRGISARSVKKGSSSPVTIGPVVEAATSSASSDRIRLLKVTPTSAGSMLSIALRAKATDGTARIRAVLYSDSAGTAGALLAQSSEQVGLTTNTNYALNLTAPYAFASGVPLWIGFHFGTSTPTIAVASGLTYSSRTSNSDTYSDGPATTYVGNFSTPANDWLFWANVTY